jgi:DNA-binding XRE family transcriptional regulator
VSKLKRFRLATDTSQAELAEILGVDQTFVSLLEQGRRAPSLRVAMAYDRWARRACRRARLAAADRPTLGDLEGLALSLEGARAAS